MQNAMQSLLDMGVTEDVARDALNRTGGDVEAAAGYIFSNELPEQFTQPIMENTREGSFVGVGEHVELASGSNAFKKGDLSDIIATTRTQQIIDTDSDYSDLNVENSIPNETTEELSVHKLEINDPTIVLPLPPNCLLENYFALFSLFVVTYLPQYLFKTDFKDLNYDKDWFKGHFINKPFLKLDFDDDQQPLLTTNPKDNTIIQPELLWQLQKFGSVENSSISDRAFVRSKMFAIAADPQIQRRLSDSEHLYEILPSFIKSLVIDFEMGPTFEEDEIKNLFISSAYHTPSENVETEQTWLSLFHFLPEEYDTNLYRMFNVLLYPEDLHNMEMSQDSDLEEESNENSLNRVAPILTIVFDEMDESTEPINPNEGVEIPLKFYPQIYTKSCKDKLINSIIEKRKHGQLLSRRILQDITNLKSFQGKDILKFLNSSITYLQQDKKGDELVNELLSLRNQITTAKTEKMNEYKRLVQQLQTDWNLSHPEISIVNEAKKLDLIDEPYILTMAAISPYHYYARNRKGVWSYVQCNVSGTDFKVRSCSSELEVQDAVKQCTRQPSDSPLMFIYCKESFIPTEDQVCKALEQNQGCINFLKDDQLELNRSQQSPLHDQED